jgi:hypothetical protein
MLKRLLQNFETTPRLHLAYAIAAGMSLGFITGYYILPEKINKPIFFNVPEETSPQYIINNGVLK